MTFRRQQRRRLINDNISGIAQKLLLLRLRFDNCHLSITPCFVCMEPQTRIELAPSAWKADVLPLNYCGRCRARWKGTAPGKGRKREWGKGGFPLGADGRARTDGLLITSQLRYQLRHVSVW